MNISLVPLILVSVISLASLRLPSHKTASAYQPGTTETMSLLRRLYPRKAGHTYLKPDDKTQPYVKEKLLEMARNSPEKRNEIINSIIQVLDDPAFYKVFITDGCRALCDTLIRLRATQSIDTIVKHIDYHGLVVGLSLGSYPFAMALISFGGEAVPKLEAGLRRRDGRARYVIVETLGEIGGRQAKAALERAQKVERDKKVIEVIQRTLPNMQE